MPTFTTLKSHITRAATTTRSTLTRGSHVAWAATAKQLRRLGIWLSGVGEKTPPGIPDVFTDLTPEQITLIRNLVQGMSAFKSSLTAEVIAAKLQEIRRDDNPGGRIDPLKRDPKPRVPKVAQSLSTDPKYDQRKVVRMELDEKGRQIPPSHIIHRVNEMIKTGGIVEDAGEVTFPSSRGDVIPEQHAEVVEVKPPPLGEVKRGKKAKKVAS